MEVKTNNLFYSDADPECLCVLSLADGHLFAFVQCLDVGMDGDDRHPARYWGAFTRDDPEGSIRRIMAHGGKWPALPA